MATVMQQSRSGWGNVADLTQQSRSEQGNVGDVTQHSGYEQVKGADVTQQIRAELGGLADRTGVGGRHGYETDYRSTGIPCIQMASCTSEQQVQEQNLSSPA